MFLPPVRRQRFGIVLAFPVRDNRQGLFRTGLFAVDADLTIFGISQDGLLLFFIPGDNIDKTYLNTTLTPGTLFCDL